MSTKADSKNFKKRKDLGVLDLEYRFFQDSYEGGAAYKAGEYLVRHRRETLKNYQARLKKASYTNFCQSIVDVYNAYLYKDKITRDLAGISKSVQDEFLKNADLEGRPWSKVVREIAKLAGVYGFMLAIVDKPTATDEETKSKGAEIENGVRPYVAIYTPRDILDYTFIRIGGRLVLDEIILAEDANAVRIWRRSSWELWTKDEGKKSYTLEDRGEHSLGKVPLSVFKNQDTFKQLSGKSDINDIADINKRVYYFDSTALQIIEDAGFPFLEMDEETVKENSTKDGGPTLGTRALVVRSADDDQGTRWVEPPHTSLPQIEAWREQAIKDIRFLSRIAVADNDARGATSESGTALELRFQQLNALMVEKAENAEEFEDNVFTLVALWDKVKYVGSVTYPRRFGIRDLSHELDNALKSLALVPSKTYQAEVGKKISRAILKDIDEKTQTTIDKEIEEAEFEDITDESDDDDISPGNEKDEDDEGDK